MRRILTAAVVLVALVASVVPLVSANIAGSAAGSAVTKHLALTPATGSVVAGLTTGFLSVPDLGGGAHRVRVGVVEPHGAHRADVLFLHGHADRLDNHPAVFDELSEAGVRVISFDLPSHGLTDAGPIDVWSFEDLETLAQRVERATTVDLDVPLVLAGWSFGGLLATRLVQQGGVDAGFERPLAGLALEVPALAPYPTAGGDGISRLRALTHDLRAPVAGPPKPPSPLQDPIFAGRLLLEAAEASARPLPEGLRTFVELSDPADDLYVDVTAVERWATGEARSDDADVQVRSCAGARHGLDFEAYPIGPAARQAIVSFVVAAADDRPTPSAPKGSVCR